MDRNTDSPVISVRGLGKRFRRGADISLKSLFSLSSGEKEFWAFKDLDFDIYRGDGIGIIGHNGAGKSTLLKVLSRVLLPTEGEATIRGRVNSLLEVGTGFQRELSGRDNIFLNASILGMARDEVCALFDEIVAFSGVGDFIDMPVKHYSSGMYSRLAFSVAAHVTGNILLVDEVLSVGDAEFRRKSLSRMSEMMQSEKRTVLFVSHSMDAIVRFCNRVIWLDHGRLREFGPAEEVVRAYLASVDGGAKRAAGIPVDAIRRSGESEESSDSQRVDLRALGTTETDCARFVHAYLADEDGRQQSVFFRNETIRLCLSVEVVESGLRYAVGVSVRCAPRKGVVDETVVFTSFSESFALSRGRHTFAALIPKHLFASGIFTININLVSPGSPLVKHHLVKRVLGFHVVDKDIGGDIMGESLRGVVQPNVLWSYDED